MHRSLVLVMAGVLSALASSPAAAQVYVDVNATGVEDGMSWCTAYRSLSAGLTNSTAGTIVYIADGEYVPDNVGPLDRTNSFVLPDNRLVIGGQAGCGAVDPDAFDPLVYQTVLSGDLNGDDGPGFANFADNCLHVVTVSGGSGFVHLEGVTVRGGNANGPCCAAPANGGGLLATNAPDLRIEGCVFTENLADRGGAISALNSLVRIKDSVFVGNEATGDFGLGGAIFALAFAGTTEIQNCLFAGNEAESFGGAVLNGSIMMISNSTIAENTAGEDGGGVFNANVVTISDSILWDNVVVKGGSTGESAQVVNTTMPEALVVDYTCIQGLTGLLGGVGNIGDDPAFRPGPLDNYYLADGSFDPGPVSPCVDAGSDSAANLSLDHLTTAAAEEQDSTVVDMGFHRPISGLPIPRGDGDRDGDVDLRDVAMLQGCFAGPDAIVPPGCRFYEYDGDLDIDTDDYPPFSDDLTGP